MTVRWKPLLVLSGLFLVVALVGVVAITLSLVPRSSQGILKMARGHERPAASRIPRSTTSKPSSSNPRTLRFTRSLQVSIMTG